MKLKAKIHLFSTFLTLVILGLMNIGIYFIFESMAFDTEYNQLNSEVDELVAALSKMGVDDDPATILRAFIPPNGGIRVINAEGDSIVFVESIEEMKEYTPELHDGERYTSGYFRGVPVLTITKPVIWKNGEVVEIHTLKQLVEVDKNLNFLQWTLIGVTLIGMLLMTISSVTLGNIITKPVNKLIKTMSQSRMSGKYQKIELSKNRKDEMTQMGIAFNEMMEQLEENYNKQEQFVSDASHELKTPLTVIESYAKLLSRHGFKDKAIAEESVNAIIHETARMKEMISQMLLLAKGNGQHIQKTETIDLLELVENTLQSMRTAYNRKFIIKADGPIYVNTDMEQLTQLLFIILDNARKYSEKEIKTTITEEENRTVVAILDYGNGIPKKDIDYIFNRFYRVDEDRNRKTGGTGLGLSIAKDIANRLSLELEIDSTIGFGTTIYIFIPKSPILINF